MSLTNPKTPISQQDLQDFYHKILPYISGGGTTYTAGDGIDITSDVISTDNLQSGDMDDVVTPLPSIPARYHKYSTDEQIVGEWIDGSPIYEKTWNLNTVLPASSASPKSVNITLQNIGTLNIENVVGYTVCAKGKNDYAGSYLTTDGSGANIQSYLSVSNGYVQVGQSQTSYSDQFTVIACTIRYTKTTD